MPASQKEIDPLPASIEYEDSVVPLVTLQNAIHYWWFVALLIVAGGLVGLLIYSLRAPVYEAIASISSSIDYVATGPMSQLEEDVALNGVGDMIISRKTINLVVETARAKGITTSVEELKQTSVLERRVNVWVLRVRGTDPQRAAQLANIWIDQGEEALLTAYDHAVKAEHLDRYLRSLEACLSEVAVSEPSGGLCEKIRFTDLQDDLAKTGKLLVQERQGSRTIFPGLRIGTVEHAAVPSKPVLYGRNQTVLAGALIGFLLSIWLVQLGIPGRLIKRR